MTAIENYIRVIFDDVIKFHYELEQSGNEIKTGIIDHGRIEAAVNAPFATFWGVDLYPSIFDKAAALWHGLANDHGFEDGNKRTATHSMLCFLGVNDINLEYSQKELSDMAVLVGSGNSKISRQEISDWIKKRAYKN